MDTDRILVLDDGRVAELDSPSKLLANSSGMLRAMVDATGEASAIELEEIAKVAAAAAAAAAPAAAAPPPPPPAAAAPAAGATAAVS